VTVAFIVLLTAQDTAIGQSEFLTQIQTCDPFFTNSSNTQDYKSQIPWHSKMLQFHCSLIYLFSNCIDPIHYMAWLLSGDQYACGWLCDTEADEMLVRAHSTHVSNKWQKQLINHNDVLPIPITGFYSVLLCNFMWRTLANQWTKHQ